MQLSELSKAERLFVEGMCDALTETLSKLCSSRWHVEFSGETKGPLAEAPTVIWVRCSLQGSYGGDAMLAFPVSVLQGLSTRDVPGDTAGLDKATLITALETGLSRLGAALDDTGLTSVRVEAIPNPTLADGRHLELLIHSVAREAEKAMAVHVWLSQQLIAVLQGSGPESLRFPDTAAFEAGNLDLVMGVELNVTLRFGQRQLALREVMELTSGSVVELDRQVDEPVELILDGRVVARGEAVIIDGNYGMRVTQLVSSPFL